MRASINLGNPILATKDPETVDGIHVSNHGGRSEDGHQ
jgi:hypothetical protein